jgi:hypothetical protein
MRRSLVFLMLMSVSAAAVPAPEGKLSKTCRPAEILSSGSATSEQTAKRNAKVSLMVQLNSRYPGDFSSRILGAAGYKCEKRLLWLCVASVRYCQ